MPPASRFGGILLPGPVVESELTRLVSDLGITVPMTVDEHQDRDRVLEALGTRCPLWYEPGEG